MLFFWAFFLGVFLCVQCCQFLWIVHLWLSLRFYLTFMFSPNEHLFYLYHAENKFHFDWMIMRPFYIAIPLRQQSVDKHVALLRRIILVRIQAVFLLTPYYFVFSGEAANTNCIIFVLTWPDLELIIYLTREEHTNQYTTDAVCIIDKDVFHFYLFLRTRGVIHPVLKVTSPFDLSSRSIPQTWKQVLY